MAHHGMNEQHGINAMCSLDENHEGRFGRLFRNLNPSSTPPSELQKIGKENGPMDGGKGRNPSVTIPMGFVFLGQFIDHDITLDTTSALDRVNDENATQNFRTPSLDLDCIYGSGPEAHNYLYHKDGMHLHTADSSTALGSQNNNHRNNDLSRTSEGTAIIGDPRNDENRIISQLQLAFIKFHNKVVDHIITDKGYSNQDFKDDSSLAKKVFEEARETVTWHYQWVVLHEFLPVMVGKPLVSKILKEGRRYYNPKRSFIPIEFSAAAYRFGHSLAPQKLKVRTSQANDFDLFGPTLGFGFSPITNNNQIVEWETMFDIDPASPAQRTDVLDTKLPADLLNLPFIPDDAEKSLATRNLLRGQSFLLPSGELVATHIGVKEEDVEEVVNYIESISSGIDLTNGIPLWLYILAEAERIGKFEDDINKPGEGLGEVGGTIVCETLIGLLEKDLNSFMSKNRNWSPDFGTDGHFTMADLLTF